MRVSRLFTMTLAVSVVIGAVILALDAATPKTGLAAARGKTAIESASAHHAAAQDAAHDGDQRLPVQLWTVVAAAGAMGVGLVLFLVRIALGRVKPPPSQEETHH